MAKVKIDQKLTEKVAGLARLDLTPDEIKLYTGQLAQILEYVEELESVDVSRVEPLTHPHAGGALLRPDKVSPFPPSQDGTPRILECAPRVEAGGFEVPSIVGGET